MSSCSLPFLYHNILCLFYIFPAFLSPFILYHIYAKKPRKIWTFSTVWGRICSDRYALCTNKILEINYIFFVCKKPFSKASGKINIFSPTLNLTRIFLFAISIFVMIPSPKVLCYTADPFFISGEINFIDCLFSLFSETVFWDRLNLTNVLKTVWIREPQNYHISENNNRYQSLIVTSRKHQ